MTRTNYWPAKNRFTLSFPCSTFPAITLWGNVDLYMNTENGTCGQRRVVYVYYVRLWCVQNTCIFYSIIPLFIPIGELFCKVKSNYWPAKKYIYSLISLFHFFSENNMTQCRFIYEHRKWNLWTETSCVCLLCKVMVCTKYMYILFHYSFVYPNWGAVFHGQR
jgi:hypothetical protein